METWLERGGRPKTLSISPPLFSVFFFKFFICGWQLNLRFYFVFPPSSQLALPSHLLRRTDYERFVYVWLLSPPLRVSSFLFSFTSFLADKKKKTRKKRKKMSDFYRVINSDRSAFNKLDSSSRKPFEIMDWIY